MSLLLLCVTIAPYTSRTRRHRSLSGRLAAGRPSCYKSYIMFVFWPHVGVDSLKSTLRSLLVLQRMVTVKVCLCEATRVSSDTWTVTEWTCVSDGSGRRELPRCCYKIPVSLQLVSQLILLAGKMKLYCTCTSIREVKRMK